MTTRAKRGFRKTTAEAFAEATERAERREFLTRYGIEELRRMRLYLHGSGDAGYGITAEGELVGVFNRGRHGLGAAAVRDALRRGVRRLDCFDGFLPGFYSRLGFAERGRAAWDEHYAPGSWDYGRYGRPDVVFMERAA